MLSAPLIHETVSTASGSLIWVSFKSVKLKAGLHGTICPPDLSVQRLRSANLARILTADERPIHGMKIGRGQKICCSVSGRHYNPRETTMSIKGLDLPQVGVTRIPGDNVLASEA